MDRGRLAPETQLTRGHIVSFLVQKLAFWRRHEVKRLTLDHVVVQILGFFNILLRDLSLRRCELFDDFCLPVWLSPFFLLRYLRPVARVRITSFVRFRLFLFSIFCIFAAIAPLWALALTPHHFALEPDEIKVLFVLALKKVFLILLAYSTACFLYCILLFWIPAGIFLPFTVHGLDNIL